MAPAITGSAISTPAAISLGAAVPVPLPYVRRNCDPARGPMNLNCNSFVYWVGGVANAQDAVPLDLGAGVPLTDVNISLPVLEETLRQQRRRLL